MRKLPTLQIILAAVVLLLSAGCTTMQPLSSTQPAVINSKIAIGDKVKIVCVSGDQIEMQVEEKTATGLRGDGQFVAYADMVSIKVRRIDGYKAEKTARVVGGILLVPLVLYALQGYGAGVALGGI
jgi:hypothetical protein